MFYSNYLSIWQCGPESSRTFLWVAARLMYIVQSPSPARSNVYLSHLIAQSVRFPVFFATAHGYFPRHRGWYIIMGNPWILLQTRSIERIGRAVPRIMCIEWSGRGLRAGFIEWSTYGRWHGLRALWTISESDGDLGTPSGWCLLLRFWSPCICW